MDELNKIVYDCCCTAYKWNETVEEDSEVGVAKVVTDDGNNEGWLDYGNVMGCITATEAV